MKRKQGFETVFRAIWHYFLFFLLVAFVTTSCMSLFVSVFSSTLDISLTDENVGVAAKLTFLNVLLISLIFTLIDSLRRRYTVIRPAKKIANAAEKLIQGDFSVRIDETRLPGSDEAFFDIIKCVNQVAAELESVETLRTDFTANVSHELKTPLSVIGNYATLLKDPNLSSEKRIEYANAIGDCARRTSDMITNILRLNRLENQQIYPKSEKFDLGEQLRLCLLQFEDIWESKNIDVDTDLDDGVCVCADSELLSPVWNNLLSNAFKFTQSGGKVCVSLKTDGEFAVVKISDSGCGMTQEVGKHVFEKFYQGDTSHASEGNGLGLALVKRVIDIMQAEITLESCVGVGTTFTVKLRRCA